jgi:hypothetical protein
MNAISYSTNSLIGLSVVLVKIITRDIAESDDEWTFWWKWTCGSLLDLGHSVTALENATHYLTQLMFL